MDMITSLTSQVLNKAMDGLSMRHKAISSNLANVDTPEYKRRDVTFENSLEKAIEEANNREAGTHKQIKQASNDEEIGMKATNSKHFGGNSSGGVAGLQPQITETGESSYRNDGSGVDVETEMVQLAKNTQRYLALTNLQGRFNRTLRSSINSGS